MSHYVLSDDDLAEIGPLLSPKAATALQARLKDADVLHDADLGSGMDPHTFSRTFLAPVAAWAKEAGLLLAAIVAEPAADRGECAIGARATCTQDLGVGNGRKVIKALIRDFWERG